ncbi:hypothetical protein H4217_009436, partial [Coemansia sp. RSA 1939]
DESAIDSKPEPSAVAVESSAKESDSPVVDVADAVDEKLDVDPATEDAVPAADVAPAASPAVDGETAETATTESETASIPAAEQSQDTPVTESHATELPVDDAPSANDSPVAVVAEDVAPLELAVEALTEPAESTEPAEPDVSFRSIVEDTLPIVEPLTAPPTADVPAEVLETKEESTVGLSEDGVDAPSVVDETATAPEAVDEPSDSVALTSSEDAPPAESDVSAPLPATVDNEPGVSTSVADVPVSREVNAEDLAMDKPVVPEPKSVKQEPIIAEEPTDAAPADAAPELESAVDDKPAEQSDAVDEAVCTTETDAAIKDVDTTEVEQSVPEESVVAVVDAPEVIEQDSTDSAPVETVPDV